MLPLLFSMLGGVLLILVLYVILPLRSLFARTHRCPRCRISSSLVRVPRLGIDRFLGHAITCHRFKCLACNWRGLLRGSAARPAQRTSPSRDESPSLITVMEGMPGASTEMA